MITRFIEATQKTDNYNHGKFMVARFDADEAKAMTAMPGYEEWSLWRIGGQRKLHPGTTLVVDLQTGEGAAFSLKGSWPGAAKYDLDAHKIWVCPMYEHFLGWLYRQGLGDGAGDITTLPRYVEIDTLEGSVAGYRRDGSHAGSAPTADPASPSNGD